jgi:hypothetical protein
MRSETSRQPDEPFAREVGEQGLLELSLVDAEVGCYAGEDHCRWSGSASRSLEDERSGPPG